jgi:hypothetical protein
MFVTQHRLVPVPFWIAQVRLVKLVEQGGLDAASWRAYEGRVGHFISVGPLGSVSSASKLLRVRFLDPVYRDDAMTIGLRWEAGAHRARRPVR